MLCWETLGPGINVDHTLHAAPIQTPLQAHPFLTATPLPCKRHKKTALEWLEEHDEELKESTWLQNSPDSNPIEHFRYVQEQGQSVEALT